jgi:hypothetical protein
MSEERVMTTLRVRESYHRSLAVLAVAAPALILAGCDPEPAVLTADLLAPATASAQFFHGNCFAGWSVRVDLRVAERQRVDVFLDDVTYVLADRGSGLRLREESLDGAGLELAYGFQANVVMAGSSRVYGLVGVTGDRPVGPLDVTGELSGRDENGHLIRTSFQLAAALDVQDPGPPRQGGACSASSRVLPRPQGREKILQWEDGDGSRAPAPAL